MTNIIELVGVTREFGRPSRRVRALDGVDLAVPPGQIIGVLGDNGAGKTTLLRIIATLLVPSSGSVSVCGVDSVAHPERVRELMAVTFGGDRGLYSRLSGRQNLDFFATLRGLRGRTANAAVSAALKEVGLEPAADRLVESYSRGMRQRLHLAIGTLVVPRLLLLDEPTVGLDPLEAERTRKLVANIADEGTTVVLTSHLLRDIEALASRVVMLRQGRMVHDLPKECFLQQTGSVGVAVITSSVPLDEVSICQVGRLLSSGMTDSTWTTRVGVAAWSSDVLRVLSDLCDQPGVLSTSIERTSLEEVYATLAAGEEST